MDAEEFEEDYWDHVMTDWFSDRESFEMVKDALANAKNYEPNIDIIEEQLMEAVMAVSRGE